MKILEVFVFIDDKNYGIQYAQIFVSGEALLAYMKECFFPKAKHLRLSKWQYSNQFSLLNWNTQMLPRQSTIFKTELRI